MGLVDDKKSIFTTIGAFTSLKEAKNLPDSTNSFTSINNKKDSVSFLLDILKVVAGSTALKELIGKLFTILVDTIEPLLKTQLKCQMIQYNSNDILPTYFRSNGLGLIIPVKSIDFYNKFKINPNTLIGSLIYDKLNPNFDYFARQAIVNNDTDVTYKNLIIRYESSTDNFILRANNSTDFIGDWFINFIDETNIINKKEFMSNTLNAIYGTLTANSGKSVEQISKEQKTNKIIEQLTENVDDDNSFIVSQNDIDSILTESENLSKGVVYHNMGCGLVEASLELTDLSNVISQISGSTDPFLVGNVINSTVDSSMSNNKDVGSENDNTIKDGFFQKLIKAFTVSLTYYMTTAPQIRMLLAVKSAFENNGVVNLTEPQNDLSSFKVFIKGVIKLVMGLINEFIFGLITSYLISLLKPIIKKIIKEKINQYIGIIKSLVS